MSLIKRVIKKRRGILFGLLALLILNTGFASELISGKFSLRNHLGELVTEASYNGQYRLVFFGFTHCPDVCPTTMSTIGKALSALEEDASLIKPLFISVDHERDTSERLANYVSYFHPSTEGLTGTEEQIKTAAENFNTAYGKNLPGSSSDWYHSSYLYLMDKEGKFLDLFSHASSVESLTSQLQDLLY